MFSERLCNRKIKIKIKNVRKLLKSIFYSSSLYLYQFKLQSIILLVVKNLLLYCHSFDFIQLATLGHNSLWAPSLIQRET
jgi:hypothetical protein